MLLSGRQTLSSIDKAVIDENEQITSTDRRVAEVAGRLVELQQEQARDYRSLARLRVEHLSTGALVDSIDQTERQVLALLQARESAAGLLQQEIAGTNERRRVLEDARARQADVLDQATESVDAAEAATQSRLDADPGYQAQRERAREADRVAMHAEDKASRSEQELEEKGRSYREDPLFIYLWRRQYGTPGYRAGGLTRWLDGKVARLIGYADARANYSRLQEIPVRLREHAGEARQQADTEFESLQDMERRAREADGIPPLEAAQAAKQEKLDAIDADIAELEQTHENLLQRQQAFASGEDENYQQAVAYLASGFQREDLRELRQEALATPLPDDDVIIGRLQVRQAEREEIEGIIQDLKASMQQHRQRLHELESLRREFKRQRYDQAGSGFANGALVGMMLENFLKGMLNRDDLLRVLRQQRRYHPRHSDPTFGSGGFGRGTIWNGGLGRKGRGWPGSIGGHRGGGIGGMGGGGGFKTGGGF